MLKNLRVAPIRIAALGVACGMCLLPPVPSRAAGLVTAVGRPIVDGSVRLTVSALRDATRADEGYRAGQRVLILEGTVQNAGTSRSAGHYTSALIDARGVSIPERPQSSESWSLAAHQAAPIRALFYPPHAFVPVKIVLTPHQGTGWLPVTVTLQKPFKP
jgi:hypothetical protein